MSDEKRGDPKIKFVNLHAHDTFSEYDGFGLTETHYDFAYENGLDAHAITNHGHMNSLTYQVFHTQKMRAEGREMKPIFGVEAYWIPSIETWRRDMDNYRAAKDAFLKVKSRERDPQEGERLDAEAKRLRRRRHLVLLAQNQEGLSNLFQLCTKSNIGDAYYRYPRVDLAMLAEHSEGVIATSACLSGIYAGDMWRNRDNEAAALDAMRESTVAFKRIFGDRWFAEIQWNLIPEQHQLNHMVIKIAKEYGIPLVTTVDCHYPNPKAWYMREFYKRLGPMKDLHGDMPSDILEVGGEYYPKNGDQVWQDYQLYCEALGEEYDDDVVLASIERSYEIAHDMIEDFTPDNTVRLPGFVLDEGETEEEKFTRLVSEGISKIEHIPQEKRGEYVARIKEEMDVIIGRGFCKYFITMARICEEANGQMLSGTGRGSASGCLVAYLLGITQVDPIRWGLLFSRFLRKDAKDYPDIDFDVARRGFLRDYLERKWGQDKVVSITNWNRLKLKSIIKDIAKYEGISFSDVNAVTSVMMEEATPGIKAERGQSAGVLHPPATLDEVKRHSPTLSRFLNFYPGFEDRIVELNGMVRSTGRHAGGVVIAERLPEFMPMIRGAKLNKEDAARREEMGLDDYILQTPWSEGMAVHHLEPMGFLKFDLLGLSTLETFEHCIGYILRGRGEEASYEKIKKFYEENLHPDVIDFNDKLVWGTVFEEGVFPGIFQFTNHGAQQFVQQVKPKDLVELATVTSIFRPGPLSANVHEDYVNAKRYGATYENEIVEELTKETHGFLVFQEQIALIAHRLGEGISLDDANSLRKVLVKKSPDAIAKAEKFKSAFIEGCEKKGLGRQFGEDMWEKFVYFAGYGFNKSHAVSYAMISYQCAWLFTYFPAEWCCAFLQTESSSVSKLQDAISLVRNIGFEIGSVDINYSTDKWEIKRRNGQEILVQPLNSLKGIGDRSVEEILAHRPFDSVEELLFNSDISYRYLNKGHIGKLVMSGALDDLMDDRFVSKKHFFHVVSEERPKTLRALEKLLEEPWGEGEYTHREMVEKISGVTGLYPIRMVISDSFLTRMKGLGIKGIGEVHDEFQGETIVWAVIRDASKRVTKKKGRLYMVATAIDLTFDEQYVKVWGVEEEEVDSFEVNKPYVFEAKKDSYGWSVRHVGKFKEV